MFGESERREAIEQVRKFVLNHHFDLRRVHEQWAARLDEATPELLRVSGAEGFIDSLRSILAFLGTSHTDIFQRSRGPTAWRFLIHATLRASDTGWTVVDVIPGGAADQVGLRPGDVVLEVTERTATALRVQVRPRDAGQLRELVIPLADPEPAPVSQRKLSADVGYVRISGFPTTLGVGFARSLDKAVSELNAAGTHRLVVDLRGNPGGALGSLRLMSYLCPDRRPTGYSLSRALAHKGFEKDKLPRIGAIPRTRWDEVKLALRFLVMNRDRSIVMMTEGLPPQPFHGRVVILTNEFTRSAAELVVAFANENGLARTVGTPTGGEVMGATNFRIWPKKGRRSPDDLLLRIPVTASFSWSGRCLEGEGVPPDRYVAFGPDDPQLAAAVEEVQRL